MPIFNNQVYHCPNRDCANREKLKDGEKCPECGTDAKPLGFKESLDLLKSKRQREKVAEKIENGSVQLLITDEMTEDEIKKRIQEDMLNLASHEAGTGWMRLGTLLSGNSTDQILGAGLKAIIDQNKIIIRQNELMLRALQKTTITP